LDQPLLYLPEAAPASQRNLSFAKNLLLGKTRVLGLLRFPDDR